MFQLIAFVTSILLLSCSLEKSGVTTNRKANNSRHVRNGDISTHLGVGEILVPDQTHAASGFEISPRCVITSGHVVTTQGPVWPGKYYRGYSPVFSSDTEKFVRVIRANRLDYSDHRDLAILWTKPHECTFLGTCTAVNWVPQQLTNVLPPFPANHQMYIVGYGAFQSQSPDGAGTQRWAPMDFESATLAVPAGTGSTIVLKGTAQSNANACAGDSGGPCVHSNTGEVFGVISAGAPGGASCDELTTTICTGMAGGNYEWIIDQQNTFCKPQVQVSVYVSGPVGRVVGVANGVEVINCSNGGANNNCSMPQAQEHSVTLTAIPESPMPGMTVPFKNWSGTNFCPCNGSNNPICIIDVNTYENQLPDLPSEWVTCTANFEM